MWMIVCKFQKVYLSKKNLSINKTVKSNIKKNKLKVNKITATEKQWWSVCIMSSENHLCMHADRNSH